MPDTMPDSKCTISKKDVLNNATNVINNFIKEKEMILRQRREELDATPPRYVVAGVIEKEANTLSDEIKYMKQLVIDLTKCSD